MPLRAVVETFKSNAESVYELIDFDRVVLEFAISGLHRLAAQLEEQRSNNAARSVDNFVQALGNVRANDSLRAQYETIYNQCVVLLVSYFGAAVHTVFVQAVNEALESGGPTPVITQEVKVTWRDLRRDDVPLGSVLADLIVAQRDISFQDMQSISRAFKEHLGVDLARDEDTNDIILGQACRHAIAHAGRTADARMMRQLKGAIPRRLKLAIIQDEAITFAPQEVRALGATMTKYLENLVESVERGSARGGPAV